jgi:hypothetical protein
MTLDRLQPDSEVCYRCNMRRKSTTKRSAKKDPLLRLYQAALREEGLSRSDLEAFVAVEIAPPAVRPRDVAARAIRNAVREAMREYVEKHAKTLERT